MRKQSCKADCEGHVEVQRPGAAASEGDWGGCSASPTTRRRRVASSSRSHRRPAVSSPPYPASARLRWQCSIHALVVAVLSPLVAVAVVVRVVFVARRRRHHQCWSSRSRVIRPRLYILTAILTGILSPPTTTSPPIPSTST